MLTFGNRDVCGDPDRILMGERYVCFDGYLHGPRGIKEWSGDRQICSNRNRVKFGQQLVCFNGYVFNQRGEKTWTGDTDYCGSHEIP